MRLATLTLLLTAVTTLAQEPDSSAIPKRYENFQGEWVVAPTQNDEANNEKPPELFVNVSGTQFELSGSGVTQDLPGPLEFRIPKTQKDNPYRELQRRGARKLDDIVDVENQITVFWFVGIFKWTDEGLHLALKYCGQGLEGKRFRDFRPPSSFDDEPMEGEVRLLLKRKGTYRRTIRCNRARRSANLPSDSPNTGLPQYLWVNCWRDRRRL